MNTVYNRLSARRGNQVQLCHTFFRGGVPTDPYQIVKVEIYKTAKLPQNLVATFVFPNACDPNYPSPAVQATQDLPAGACGTDGQVGAPIVGKYCIYWDIPADASAPDNYIDVWYFLPSNPCELTDFAGSTCCIMQTDGCIYPDLSCDDFDGYIMSCCDRFWVYPDDWACTSDLVTINYGFEPLNQRFHKPEVRPLEVGIMPLPLYDSDYNLNMPIIPNLVGTISISTGSCEMVVDEAPMEIGLRQGSYRSNPFVLKYTIDTSKFLIGTYKYRVTVRLPDGTTRTSGDFILTVS